VAVVGLGVGSLASYARAGQTWTFYEIDPAIERIARDTRYFTFLRDCADRCRVVLGDARLALNHAASNQFGLIVLDAFSSDAIPVHLLTREALSMYLSKLSQDGILAFHISNRHLRLAPVLARVAASHHLTAIRQRHSTSRDQDAAGQSGSEWMLMAREERHLGPLVADSRWTHEHASPSAPLWTDDFSNVLSVLEWP
jgi:spermidine synthase